LMQGMPLGTMDNFQYKIQDTTLNPGDTILLLTDGLPELQNAKGQIYGYKRVRNLFEEAAEKAPEDIINQLKNDGSAWVNEKDPEDDVTFVVIKVK
jgi:serine phosphatase RsbU (regulator of sigma subunit)